MCIRDSPRNVPAQHQDDAKLSDSVEKAEDRCSQHRPSRKRNQQAQNHTHRTCSQQPRGIHIGSLDRREPRYQRLHGKWQTVNDLSLIHI